MTLFPCKYLVAAEGRRVTAPGALGDSAILLELQTD